MARKPGSSSSSNRASPIEKAQQAFAIAAALGVAVAAIFFFQGESEPQLSDQGRLVGQVIDMQGFVELRPRRARSFRQLGNGEAIYAEQMLRTGPGATVDIDFQPGPTLRLMENSRLVAEIDPTRNEKTQATLLAGRVKVVADAESGGFTLWREGRLLGLQSPDLAAELDEVPLIRVPEKVMGIDGPADAEAELALGSAPVVPLPTGGTPLNPSGSAPGVTAGSPPVTNSSPAQTLPGNSLPAATRAAPTPTVAISAISDATLSDSEIRETVRKQGGGFQKCYIAMVNRMTQASATAAQLPRGEVKLSFRILPSGKSADVKIQSAPFQDEVFNRCVIEAMSRVVFRGFSGSAIQINEFPISLQ